MRYYFDERLLLFLIALFICDYTYGFVYCRIFLNGVFLCSQHTGCHSLSAEFPPAFLPFFCLFPTSFLKRYHCPENVL